MEQALLLFIGVIAGAAGSMIGIGGGFIIIPILMIFYPHLSSPQIATISLACVFINSLTGVIAANKYKRVDFKSALIFSVSSIPGTILATFVAYKIPVSLFRIFLGVLFLCAASLLLYNTFKNSYDSTISTKTGSFKRKIIDSFGNEYSYSFNPGLGIFASALIGFVSTLFGIGGGIFYVPLFVNALSIPVRIATATSQFGLLISSAVGSGMYISQGVLNNVSHIFLFIPLGIVFGVIAGTKFANSVKPVFIIRFFSVVVFLTGLRIIITALHS